MPQSVCALCAVGVFLIFLIFPGSTQATSFQFTVADWMMPLAQGETSGSTAMWPTVFPSP